MSIANINRRAKDVDGSSSLGLNPDGPVDRQIGLIRLERSNGSLLALIANYAMHGTVLSGSNLEISGDAPGTVSAYVEQKVVADAGELDPVIDRIIAANPGQAEQFRGGKQGLLGFFVGQVMKETGGTADPRVVNERVREKLST